MNLRRRNQSSPMLAVWNAVQAELRGPGNCTPVGFVYMVCLTKPALSRFLNALKILRYHIVS